MRDSHRRLIEATAPPHPTWASVHLCRVGYDFRLARRSGQGDVRALGPRWLQDRSCPSAAQARTATCQSDGIAARLVRTGFDLARVLPRTRGGAEPALALGMSKEILAEDVTRRRWSESDSSRRRFHRRSRRERRESLSSIRFADFMAAISARTAR